MRLPRGYYIDDAALPLLQSQVSYYGSTSGNGNALGTTVVCADLANEPSYQGAVVKLLSGAAAGQVRGIQLHPSGGATLTADRPFTDNTGAAVQVTAGTAFVILSMSTGSIISYLAMLSRPAISLYEGWVDEAGIDAAVWTVTNPATGTAWGRGATGAYLRATSVPNANETCRLRQNSRWIAAPDTYATNTILRKLIMEFELRLANVANMDNTLCFLGLTTGVGDTRATNDIVGFALLADALQTLTDDGGVETSNSGFGETLTNWNKLRMDIEPGAIRFWLNEAQIALHVTNLPDFAMYPQFFIDTEAGGPATIETGIIRMWYEDALL